MQSCVFPRMPLSPILKSVGGPDEVFNIRPTFENSPQSRQFSPTNVLNVPRPRTASSSEPCQREPAEVSMEYLAELIKERKQLEMFPTIFPNVDRLVDDEITRVRVALFQCEFMTDEIKLPEPMGEIVTITEKLYVPKKEHPDVIEETRTHPDGTVTVSHRYSPDYNFVGRILGPRGMTAKQLEQETGCKIMVRGRGSMRDRRKEELNRGKPNWEHLDDDLHVLVQCEDAENRSRIKLRAAVEQVKKLLTPAPEGTDELKRKQLMELAIINGTYRPHNKPNNIHTPRLVTPLYPVSPMRQLIVSPQHSPTGHAPMMPGSPSFQAPTLDYSKLVSPSSFMDVLSSFSISGHEMGPPLTPMGFPNGSVLGGHFFHDTHHLHSNPASPAPTTVAN